MDEQQRDVDSSDRFAMSEIKELTTEIESESAKILVHYGTAKFKTKNKRKSRFYSKFDTPPGQNSPKNIMNILNDDCLKAILIRIEDVYEFGNAALVCKRFMQNAIQCFPFKQLKFRYKFQTYGKYSRRQKDEVFYDDANTLLSIFGHKIKRINICDDCKYENKLYTDAVHKENINLIAQHCGKTLLEFFVTGTGVINLRTPMQVLKSLYTHDVVFQNLASTFPELEIFQFCVDGNVDNFDWITNHFPKLRSVCINSDLCTSDVLNQFQNLNPQLEKLSIFTNENLTSSIWCGIGHRLPNISNLCLVNMKDVLGPEIVEITTLRNLIELRLLRCRSDSIKPLLSSLIMCEQSIEKLVLDGIDMEIAEMLTNLESLKYLRIRDTSLSEIITIVRKAKRLIKLNIFYNELADLTFDLRLFELIVSLATGRIKVNFCYTSNKSKGLLKVDMLSQLPKETNEWVRFIQYPTYLYPIHADFYINVNSTEIIFDDSK